MNEKTRNIKSGKVSNNDFVKRDNERCFLPNNENIHYDSIILLEMICIEEFSNLFDGLDQLYSNLKDYEKSRLMYRKILQDDENNSFRGSLYLPPIINTKFKGQVFTHGTFQDLDDNIDSINITLQATLPSVINLQIQASLDSSYSDKINDIIYTYHDKVEEKIDTLDGEVTTIHQPSSIKKKEIDEIRNNLKNHVINFLSTYFEGLFFKQAKKHISNVPSIDLFSLNYPEETEEINEWLLNNDFYSSFNISAHPLTVYRCDNYLFFESYTDDVFSNYLIIANRKTANQNKMYSSIKSSIQYPLNHYSFELLSLNRWLEIEQRNATELNLLVSKELEYITKNDFKKVISNREKIAKYLFYFERFKIEINKFDFRLTNNSPKFELLGEQKKYLFDFIIENINRNINYMDEFINTLNRHSDNTLALKNIEYSKKMQNIVLLLTVLIIVISFVQIFLVLIQLILDHWTLKMVINHLINYLF
ncbi:hypothetical protein LI82_07640 [Methanococcoides methylutens]|uniref:Uncharacterized protein n=1 Tax=Methanococcoides methylutens TaxID=2226 RepID=A0A099T0K6_METMT|nr:hypothetical protein [Methanococcoides methylutens]KGK98710.1 hypothetical protein LI82_07640 [Methanococcoides methylutens]